jgi:hypothetical protein
MAVRREPFFQKTSTLVAGLAALIVVSAVVSGVLYPLTKKDSFGRAVADKVLQLALIVVIGAIVGLAVSRQTEARIRAEEQRDERHGFLRRLRTANQRVQLARRLLDAHDSAKTYSEQMRELIATRFELEDISQDLQEAGPLFEDQEVILCSIEQLIDYLATLEGEWQEKKLPVDTTWAVRDRRGRPAPRWWKIPKRRSPPRAPSVKRILRGLDASHVIDFIAGGERSAYHEGYDQPLGAAKRGMRREVYVLAPPERATAPAAQGRS